VTWTLTMTILANGVPSTMYVLPSPSRPRKTTVVLGPNSSSGPSVVGERVEGEEEV
jgi:hypothetical protein